ncbi:NADH:ubiquinone reductase (Na(+)-transporting) subunit C [Limimaricola variabilis]|uniref:NADH:ubiquinone reductase (Na(+)-transporting) subunit C n=1 Tax=Limimaricola variabilis TaxID=1492771 RepID=UPI002AC99635|nr:NADH:ubiquinone reductase (Na(+)-transporting) subunit C [Limimaricola variabilis]WPY94409.1 NADH:ubiquinone reductase (Na(+)-transporting) subunit C [Limimaricola variabilis]
MPEPHGIWGRFLARPNEDPVKALGMAGLVALGAALTVSTAATLLEPRQAANLEAARAARMQAMVDALPGLRVVMEEAGVTELQSRLVELESGSVLPGDATGFEAEPTARDAETGIDLPPEADIAGLGRRERVAAVHLLERDGAPVLVVLPMRGTGYQSTIHALLALEADLDTVAALTVTEQGETPGLGAQIERADWQALWPGRRIADDSGTIRIEVVRGTASTPYEVDGISGATRTGNGVTAMLRFWMGPWGYGPFLDRLAREGMG